MEIFQTITFAGIIGFLTLIVGILTKVIGLPDQIRKNYKLQSTEGLSTSFIFLAFISYMLWTLHGIMEKDIVLILGQGLGILTTGIIIWQIISYKGKK
ncbi:hypothetical protein COX08_00240 [Candidatus Beckwithbacteria bacterium CG23_combo_of_CG06-09_8_20_14_all_34_8]|uniref:MtN3 and saliva related transmembrane protein n=1 Tax=Candidatus Beckwithbacteria bacterium CG23_combo_of_CG06-09_8_20_14_all_34_8 TaxID=1974497 RepID=A0A2H0B7H5_9BACT|nr:MAG: hypothetical protein COX08_00240 [Candidatus Beckwithbacteria bacterium CG23_combo_of_CG06-09_8_20_14_all_34_8]